MRAGRRMCIRSPATGDRVSAAVRGVKLIVCRFGRALTLTLQTPVIGNIARAHHHTSGGRHDLVLTGHGRTSALDTNLHLSGTHTRNGRHAADHQRECAL